MSKPPSKADLRRAIETSFLVLDPPATSHRLSVRRVHGAAIAGAPVCVGVDEDGLWHLLLPVESTAEAPSDVRSRGIRVGPRVLVEDGSTKTFIEVTCMVSHLRRLFAILGADIVEGVLGSALPPGKVVQSVLAEWRELLDRTSSPPSETRLRAAFGELSCVRRLVTFERGAASAWKGPDGERHDFRRGKRALEVKTTDRSRHVVTIHGIEQLEPPTGGELVLVVQLVERDAAGETLFDLVEDAASRGADSGELLDSLAKLGVSLDWPEAREARFKVTSTEAYAVAEGFPGLTRADLAKGSLHPAIRTLSYTVDLGSARESLLSPEELEAFERSLATS